MRTIAAIAVLGLMTGACSLLGPQGAPWGDRVPTPDPVALGGRPAAVQNDDFTITLAPVSPRGAQVGVEYAYDMPHCGLLGEIDVDGSYWDPADGTADPAFDWAPGTFRLLDDRTALFTMTADGSRVRLVRHEGPKDFPLCS